jgi:hypothetical protein
MNSPSSFAGIFSHPRLPEQQQHGLASIGDFPWLAGILKHATAGILLPIGFLMSSELPVNGYRERRSQNRQVKNAVSLQDGVYGRCGSRTTAALNTYLHRSSSRACG